ncbi:MAG: carboxypeptidase-like regulatory domain-containing protein [Planctomycetaceae bacterium]
MSAMSSTCRRWTWERQAWTTTSVTGASTSPPRCRLSRRNRLPLPPPPPPSSDPPPPLTIGVDYIGYTKYGGKTSDKNLRIEVDIADDAGAPVPNATVAVRITRNGSNVYTGSVLTDANGAWFTISNARSGTYSTIVTNVTATGDVWDQIGRRTRS